MLLLTPILSATNRPAEMYFLVSTCVSNTVAKLPGRAAELKASKEELVSAVKLLEAKEPVEWDKVRAILLVFGNEFTLGGNQVVVTLTDVVLDESLGEAVSLRKHMGLVNFLKAFNNGVEEGIKAWEKL